MNDELIAGINFVIASGLTTNELKAYRCFLLKQELTAEEISDTTGMSLQLVYQYLRKMQDKKMLIEKFKIKNKRTYKLL